MLDVALHTIVYIQIFIETNKQCSTGGFCNVSMTKITTKLLINGKEETIKLINSCSFSSS